MEKENKDVLEPQEEEKLEVNEEQEAEETTETTETTEVEAVEATETTEEVKEEKEEKVEEPYEGLEATVDIKYDFRTMKYFNMYNMVVKKKLPLWYGILGGLTGLLTIYTIVSGIIGYNKDPEKGFMSTILFAIVFLLFTFYLIKQAIKFEDLIDKTITNHFATHKVAEQHIRVRENKITLIPCEKPEDEFSYDWTSVTSIEEIDQFFFLYIGKSPIIISKDPNSVVDGTYEDLIKIINDKTKSIAYKICKKNIVKKPITYVHKDLEEKEAEAVEMENNEEEHTCHCEACEEERKANETVEAEAVEVEAEAEELNEEEKDNKTEE